MEVWGKVFLKRNPLFLFICCSQEINKKKGNVKEGHDLNTNGLMQARLYLWLKIKRLI
jgi:hypothetical protein